MKSIRAGHVATATKPRPLQPYQKDQLGLSDVIKVRCPASLKHRLVIHAQSRGEEFSAWVRRVLRTAADREATYRVAGPVFLDSQDVAEMAKKPIKHTAEETAG